MAAPDAAATDRVEVRAPRARALVAFGIGGVVLVAVGMAFALWVDGGTFGPRRAARLGALGVVLAACGVALWWRVPLILRGQVALGLTPQALWLHLPAFRGWVRWEDVESVGISRSGAQFGPESIGIRVRDVEPYLRGRGPLARWSVRSKERRSGYHFHLAWWQRDRSPGALLDLLHRYGAWAREGSAAAMPPS